MVAKIPITIEDETQPGFDSIISSTKKVSKEMEELEKEGSDAQRMLDFLGTSSKKTRDRFDDLADEVKRTEHALDDVKDSSKSAGTSMTGDFVKALVSFELLKKAFELGADLVMQMAEEGDPAAQKLVDSFSGVREAFMKAAQDPGIAEMMEGIADTINDYVIPAITAMPQAIRDFQEAVADTVIAWGEWLGVVEEGTGKVLDGIQAEEKKRLEQEKVRRDQQRAEIKRQKELEETAKDRQAAEEKAAAEREQWEIAEFNRRAKLMAEMAAKEKEAARIKEQEAEKIAAKQKELDDEAAEKAKEAQEEKAKKYEEYVDSILDKFKELSGEKDKEAGQELVGKFSQQDITEQVARTRDEAIKKEFDDKRAMFEQDPKKRTKEEKQALAQLGREEARARKDARRETFQQGKAGELDADAVSKATEDLANGVIDQGLSQGTLNQSTADALRKSAKLAADNKANTEKLTDQVEDINEFLELLNKPSTRSRAQRAGSR